MNKEPEPVYPVQGQTVISSIVAPPQQPFYFLQLAIFMPSCYTERKSVSYCSACVLCNVCVCVKEDSISQGCGQNSTCDSARVWPERASMPPVSII